MLDPQFLKQLGIFQEADGSYKRHRVRIRNLVFGSEDPKGLAGKPVSWDEELVPFPVVLPLATDPASIEEARLKAVKTNSDFYHPKWGWLRWGVKREQEHPENLGAGAVQYERRRVVVGRDGPEPVLASDGSAPDQKPGKEPR